ncbi:hypothetical protein HJC23_013356 [Cyclotella cryptica]|uniref:Uncharacterized protein n=1 Tax=Cyclotella cryptica TaxID=29204 RepID=A0ABD3P9Z0_9STRA
MAIIKELESNSVASDLEKVSLHLTNETESSSMDGAFSLALKPARRHRQFLPDANHLEFERLKGYDHTLETRSCRPDSFTSPCSSEKVSAVKKRGGGSWLLGFARLRDEPSSPSVLSSPLPDLVRSNSSSSLESSSTEDDASLSSSSSSSSKKKGVSFNETATVLPIPHASTLTPQQRRKMFSSSIEVRQNKIRNKKEYRYDGYDWRNCTEEWEMSVDMVTGELVHPAHSV